MFLICIIPVLAFIGFYFRLEHEGQMIMFLDRDDLKSCKKIYDYLGLILKANKVLK
jgi:hypothetical protein